MQVTELCGTDIKCIGQKFQYGTQAAVHRIDSSLLTPTGCHYSAFLCHVMQINNYPFHYPFIVLFLPSLLVSINSHFLERCPPIPLMQHATITPYSDHLDYHSVFRMSCDRGYRFKDGTEEKDFICDPITEWQTLMNSVCYSKLGY